MVVRQLLGWQAAYPKLGIFVTLGARSNASAERGESVERGTSLLHAYIHVVFAYFIFALLFAWSNLL